MEKRNSIKVAIFTLLGIGVLIVGYIWFTEFRLNLKRYHYESRMKDVSWLERGDIVTLMGVNVGRVEGLSIEDNYVVVRFFVDNVPLREGAKIYVENQGFLGRKRVVIHQGSGKVLPRGAQITGTRTPDLGDLIAATDQILKKGKEMMDRIESTINGIDTTLLVMKKNIVSLTKELKRTAGSIKKLVKKGEGIDTTMAKIDSLTKRAELLLKKIEQGEGTAGKLLNDPSLYNEINETLNSLKDLIEDVKKNPKKYLKIEIF